LTDCPEPLNSKLDARISIGTFHTLKSAAAEVRLPVSVYVRKLLYHFYVTKRVSYVGSEGHYTLAGRHD
jgi:hypothetical protein